MAHPKTPKPRFRVPDPSLSRTHTLSSRHLRTTRVYFSIQVVLLEIVRRQQHDEHTLVEYQEQVFIIIFFVKSKF